MTRRSNQLGWSAVACLLLASFARPAGASTTFPEALRSQLGLAEIVAPAPGCRVCHQTDTGGLMTATKPFGRSLLKAGAQAVSVPSLLAALDSLEEQGTDSDRDGTPDIEELRAGTDVNVASAGDGGAPSSLAEEVPLPQTGCALAHATRPEPCTWTSLALVLLWCARRARRSNGGPSQRGSKTQHQVVGTGV